jgi:hypothetical protein
MIKYFLNKLYFFYILLIALPIAIHFYTIIQHSMNIPILDDYELILSTLVNFKTAINLEEKLISLSHINCDQLSSTIKLFSILLFAITGSFNFKIFILLGNLSLIGIAYLLYKTITLPKKNLWFFLPVTLLLFQPQYHISTLWATDVFSKPFMLFLSFLSVFLLVKKQNHFYFTGALISSVLAAFTVANGFLAFLLGMPILFAKKRYSSLLIWASSLAISLLLYFHFTQYNNTPLIFFTNIHKHLIYFFSFLGLAPGTFFQQLLSIIASPLEYNLNFQIFYTAIFGIVLTLYFCYLTYTKYYKINGTLYYFMLLIMFNALAGSLNRLRYGILHAFGSNYRLFSILLIIFFYLSLFNNYPLINKFTERLASYKKKLYTPQVIKNTIITAIISCALIFNIVSYKKCTETIILNKSTLLKQTQQIKHTLKNKKHLKPYSPAHILQDTSRLNIYELDY